MIFDRVLHGFIICIVVTTGGLAYLTEEIDQLVDTDLCAVICRRRDLVLNAGIGCAGLLGSVILQTYNIGRVDSRASVICGIKILIKIEENVSHSKRSSVREFKTVLDNEIVSGISGVATGVGQGLSTLATNIFFTGTGNEQTLSVHYQYQ